MCEIIQQFTLYKTEKVLINLIKLFLERERIKSYPRVCKIFSTCRLFQSFLKKSLVQVLVIYNYEVFVNIYVSMQV